MSHLYFLLGLDTLELIRIGSEKLAAEDWSVLDHQGPILDIYLLGYGETSRGVMLPKDLLEKLYRRFAKANPKGMVITMNEEYLQYAPPELSEDQVEHLCDEGKLFPVITMDSYSLLGNPDRVSPLIGYLPELRQPEVLERLGTDPEVSLELFNQAFDEGIFPMIYGPCHWRWTPEWEAYAAAHCNTQENTA